MCNIQLAGERAELRWRPVRVEKPAGLGCAMKVNAFET
jgi:hypothetical protein